MPPGTVGRVDEPGVDLGPPSVLERGVLLPGGGAVQGGRGLHGLGHHPVEALGDDGPAVPARRVGDPRRRGVHRIGHRAVEERLRRAGEPGLRGPRGQLQEQPRPLQGVPRRGAVRAERVVGTLGVVLGEGAPVVVVVLREPPPVPAGVPVDQPLRDPQGSSQPDLVAGGVRGGEIGLDGVHVAVGAAVAVEDGPGPVPLLDAGAHGLVPEPALVHVQRIGQQPGCPVHPGAGRRRGGQDHEGVLVAGFRAAARAAVRGDLGVPAPVLPVAEQRVQGAYAVLRHVARTLPPGGVRLREDVGHPRVDPQLERPSGVHVAGVVEPAEAAPLPDRPPGEVEQGADPGGPPRRGAGPHPAGSVTSATVASRAASSSAASTVRATPCAPPPNETCPAMLTSAITGRAVSLPSGVMVPRT